MAGTLTAFALSQQHDIDGKPLVGARLSIYQAGTLTRAIAYKVPALSEDQRQPFPILSDATGRFPQFWLADGNYRAIVTDEAGVIQIEADFIPAIGASSSGESGGDVSIDTAAIAATGDIKIRIPNEILPGWVRCNGRTLGGGSSGASERANADAQQLFEYLWGKFADAFCPVIGGRGASATADWTAGKKITLPDLRGRAIFGLDDMGNSSLGLIGAAPFAVGGPTAPGSKGGEAAHVLSTSEIPTHTHAPIFTAPRYDKATAHASITQGGGAPVDVLVNSAPTDTATTGGAVSIGNAGNGGWHNTMPPFMLGTVYMKL